MSMHVACSYTPTAAGYLEFNTMLPNPFSLQEHNVQQLSQVLFPVKAILFSNTLHVNVHCGIIIYPHILITHI